MKMENYASIDETGTKRWYNLNGELHREDGPAIEYPNGTKHWYLNNYLHRADGPAVEFSGGGVRWYLNGKEITIRPMTPQRLQQILVLL